MFSVVRERKFYTGTVSGCGGIWGSVAANVIPRRVVENTSGELGR